MSTQKILQINPELFKFNNGKKSLKKKERKTKPLDDKTNSLKSNKLKKELLKRVKDYQKNKELETQKGELEILEDTSNASNLFNKSEFENSDFDREFNKSLTFLHELSKKKKDKRNKTLKSSIIDVNVEIPKDSHIYNNTNNTNNNVKLPSYSCLKNGSKPTLKDLNKTQKNNNQGSGKRLIIDLNNNKYYDSKTTTFDTDTNPIITQSQEIEIKPQELQIQTQELQVKPNEIQIQTQELQVKPNEIQMHSKELQATSKELQAKPITYSYNNDSSNLSETNLNTTSTSSTASSETLKYSEDDSICLHIPKINRTTRTYKYTLGKKNGARHIGLLIKNRETQKRIKHEVSQLKQQPIQEIKNYLRNKNLIKLGSQAPNDVLRKLYEDSILAGEITNNNTNNLVYNFIN
jgi:hypothetical protein